VPEPDMSTWEIILRLAAGVVLTAMNALFVLTEFALTRAPQLGKDKFQDSAALRKAWKITEELEIYLTGCQLGISTTSVLLGVLAEPGVTALIRPLGEAVGLSGDTLRITSVVVAVVLINLIHKIWGEQAPTYFGVEKPLVAAKIGAPFLYLWTKALMPLVMAGDGIAKLTLKLFGVEVTRSWVDGEGPQDGDQAAASGRYGDLRRAFNELMIDHHIPPDRRDEVIGALEIDLVPTSDVMVHRQEVATLCDTDDIDASFDLIGQTKKTRYPIVSATGEVLGVLYIPSLFADRGALRAGDRTLADLAVDPVWVEHDLDIGSLIDELQARRQEMALVRDAQRRWVGVVTITDAFEYIAGEVQDPYDDELDALAQN